MKSKSTPYKILTYPHDLLRQKAVTVTKFDQDLKLLANNMLMTLLTTGGIGLAANQVGILQRVVIILTENFQGVMVNPQIVTKSSELSTLAEGCLSFPGQRVSIDRPATIYVAWYNLDGTGTSREFTGITAKCVQHEIDHLDGKLIEDYKGENDEL